MADWLCNIVVGHYFLASRPASVNKQESPLDHYSDVIYPKLGNNEPQPTFVDAHTRGPVHPSPGPVPDGFEGAGAGRLLTFDAPKPLSELINRIGDATGSPGAISVAIPQDQTISSMKIRTVGVCPGSGGGVLMKGSGPLPDLLFTGELSHHEALGAIERGSAVVTLFHSNSERGYLHDVMQHKLSEAISKELGVENSTEQEEPLVAVSQVDRDPFGVVVRN